MVVVNKLAVGLSDEVFSVEGKKVIEATRVILDLPTLAVKIKETRASPIKVAEVEFTKFAKAVSEISVNSVKGISEKEMKQQFRVFLERLSIMTEKIKEPELSKTDSKELIKQFFDPSNELFKDIEMIMECMACLLSNIAVRVFCRVMSACSARIYLNFPTCKHFSKLTFLSISAHAHGGGRGFPLQCIRAVHSLRLNQSR